MKLTSYHSIVETATTVVCPYATVSTASGGVVTSVIESTTYVSITLGFLKRVPVVRCPTFWDEILGPR